MPVIGIKISDMNNYKQSKMIHLKTSYCNKNAYCAPLKDSQTPNKEKYLHILPNHPNHTEPLANAYSNIMHLNTPTPFPQI